MDALCVNINSDTLELLIYFNGVIDFFAKGYKFCWADEKKNKQTNVFSYVCRSYFSFFKKQPVFAYGYRTILFVERSACWVKFQQTTF